MKATTFDIGWKPGTWERGEKLKVKPISYYGRHSYPSRFDDDVAVMTVTPERRTHRGHFANYEVVRSKVGQFSNWLNWWYSTETVKESDHEQAHNQEAR